MKFTNRVTDLPNSGIGFMMKYGAKYPDVLTLGQGTPIFPTPQFIYDSVYERAKKDPSVGIYSDHIIENELKNFIAKEMEGFYGFTPSVENLILTSGGIGALFSGLMSLVEEGDEVIYFDQSQQSYGDCFIHGGNSEDIGDCSRARSYFDSG